MASLPLAKERKTNAGTSISATQPSSAASQNITAEGNSSSPASSRTAAERERTRTSSATSSSPLLVDKSDGAWKKAAQLMKEKYNQVKQERDEARKERDQLREQLDAQREKYDARSRGVVEGHSDIIYGQIIITQEIRKIPFYQVGLIGQVLKQYVQQTQKIADDIILSILRRGGQEDTNPHLDDQPWVNMILDLLRQDDEPRQAEESIKSQSEEDEDEESDSPSRQPSPNTTTEMPSPETDQSSQSSNNSVSGFLEGIADLRKRHRAGRVMTERRMGL